MTILLCLPAGGGGLNFWPNGLDHEKPIYRPYSEKNAVHFSGELWHQIAFNRPSSTKLQQDYRTTLQCHYLRLEGSAILLF